MVLRLLGSGLLLLLGVLVTMSGISGLRTGFEMARAPSCGEGATSAECLRETTGTLEFQRSARGGTDYWEVARSPGGTATVSVSDSEDLADGPVTVYVWDGDVVLLEQDAGRVPTLDWGPARATGPLGVGLLALGGAVLVAPPGAWAVRLRPYALGVTVAGGTLGLVGLVGGWWPAAVLALITGVGAVIGWRLAHPTGNVVDGD